MDDIFESVVQELFCGLDADSNKLSIGWMDFTRKEDGWPSILINRFRNVIAERVQAGDCDAFNGYVLAVNYCLRKHAEYKAANNNVCPQGRCHQLLYLAAKLAFDGNIKGAERTEVLNNMYECDRYLNCNFCWTTSPEYMFCKLINSDRLAFYEDYITQSHAAKLEFAGKCQRRYRGADFIMRCLISDFWQLNITSRQELDVWRHAIRYGGALDVTDIDSTNFFDKTMIHFLHKCVFNNFCPECKHRFTFKLLRLWLASVPQGKLKRIVVNKPEFRRILEQNLALSPGLFGLMPPELKHMARLKVREALNKNWQLPFGIDELKIPEPVKMYLNFCDEDLEDNYTVSHEVNYR